MTMLVIDAGSSSVRALLLDESAQPIPHAIARRDHRFDQDSTADPVHLRELIEDCIDEILPWSGDIKAVGMATFVGNLLGVDHAGEPITPLYTYADTRSHDDAVMLQELHDLAVIHARTGCRVHPAYHPAKLRWLARTHPALYGRVTQWMDLATYCYEIWFGHDVPCSYSIASWSGLLDRHTLTWDDMWLDTLTVKRDALPELADFDAVQRGLSTRYADRWKVLRDVPFYLAIGDGAAANIGSGGKSVAHPVLTVGTTAALRVVTTEAPDVSTGLWAYRVNSQRHLIGGATSEGGNIFVWAQQSLKLDMNGVDDTLLTRSIGVHGLTVLPLLAGERSPGYQGNATGIIKGLHLGSSPLDMFQALLEGVALRLRLIYDLMHRPGDYILAGGGALMHSPAWAQIIADVLQTTLHLVDVPEVTARGVALLIDDTVIDDMPDTLRVVTPRPSETKRVAVALDAHRQLYYQLYR